MPEQATLKRNLFFSGLIVILAFPAAKFIPVINYVVQTVAIFFAIFMAFERKLLMLVLGVIGSLAMTLYFIGPYALSVSEWARVLIPSVLMGYLLSSGYTVSRSFVFALIGIALFSLIFIWVGWEALNQSWVMAEEWIAGGIFGNTEQGKALADGLTKMIGLVKRLFPSILVLSGITQLFIALIALIIILKYIGEYSPYLVSFYYWKMPEYYLYMTGLVLLIRLISRGDIQIIADNFLLLVGFIYAAFGFSVFEYYLKKIKLSLFLRIMFYIGILLLQLPGLILAALVGLFDSYFDFRKVRARIIG
jgi:uncharacterized protein YybS (DUF2232 family)